MQRLILMTAVCLFAASAEGQVTPPVTTTTFAPATGPGVVAGTSPQPLHFGASCAMQMMWTSGQVGAPFMTSLTHLGLQFNQAFDRSWPDVTVWIGESTVTPLTASPVFLANFNIGAPAVVAYTGPLNLQNTGAGTIARIPLTAFYEYSGTGNLMALIQVGTPGAGLGGDAQVVTYSGSGLPNLTLTSNGSTGPSGVLAANTGIGAEFRHQMYTTGIQVEIHDIGTNGPTRRPVVGSNQVRAVLRNVGTSNISNFPLTLEYSTNLGVTWSMFQTVSIPVFTSMSAGSVTLSAPWVIPANGTVTLSVRLSPPVGIGEATMTKTWVVGPLGPPPAPPPPTVWSSPTALSLVAGEPMSHTLAATGFGTIAYAATAVPAWMTLTGNVLAGTPPLTLSNQSIQVTVGALNGLSMTEPQVITISLAWNPKDLTRDLVFSVLDVQLAVNLVLQSAQPAWPGQGDPNGDSVVNVLDVQAVVNRVLNP